ncbi:MAG: thermonuclease family protein [Proteobacteria bacterium]|nr:thermonuclease family protein [Pseudomonadota bacterium]MBU1582904.1 thermonuclease family protein [Pseudomonadota bacterium]MBU2453606.1 thermonuclease family protein [Pseudomonadota bacterium]MBU2629454.1 thermonuclease family protein [Pseudomonadota bacterium]
MIKAVIYVFISLFFSLFLFGNIYFWTDENGIKHFTNIAPPLDEAVEELTENNLVHKKLILKKNENQFFQVLKIFDGDTIQVKGLDLIFKIRLVGIDSPEIGYNGQKSQPFSQKAKLYLARLLDGKRVTIKSYGTGGYDRQLAEIFVEDKNINIEMIRAGLAEVYKGKPPKNLDSRIYIAEELKARTAQIGMWVQGSFYQSPRQWRKEHPRT